ncbi:hypothetical protein Cylst_2880 [Cylindrospermum stagnale PCC 7417]|uniref:Uncharacterized protein n=1 Tax=Cylindrospermum stagnale PCC 7417 TaxID=56107 RepID=K9WY09_9NOST|nr:hypothetical protein [Cylindrospermum stagnale]AFZ25073.1 hypothetical protein Cylst_2880 [Cylindrospermum stagnale PCC 7417]
MLLHKSTVNNFIHLLKTQPTLFSPKDRLELSKLIEPQPDEIVTLSNTISDWLKQHREVNNALGEIEQEEKTDRPPGNGVFNPNIPDYQPDKKTLNNAIQQSSSPSKDDDEKKTRKN